MEKILQGKTKPGDKVGVSEWVAITQEDTNQFGRLTKDEDPLHVDPEAAAKGPFGQTIGFGFYTLSLLTHFSHELTQWENIGPGLNYGFNSVRFISPVVVGSRVRAHFTFKHREVKSNGNILTTFDVVIEIENQEKPALVAEWLGMVLPN